MICKNCGFQNQEGDEFCGSCGQYLEFAGVKTGDTEPTAAPPPDAGSAGGADTSPPPPPPTDDQTMAMPVPPPTAPPPPHQAAPPPPAPPPGSPPPPPPGGSPTATQFGGRGPDVICWNCGRRNPGGRTFCIQCGERLTAGKPTSAVKASGVAAGGAIAATPPPPSDGGGGMSTRTIALIAVALIAVLVIVGVGAAAILGNPQPSATQIAASSTPTATALPTASPSGLVSPSPSVPPTASGEPSPSPTTEPTLEPTAEPTAEPTKEPTAPPDNAVCSDVRGAGRPILFKERNAVSTLGNREAWCIRRVTFFRGTGSGTLKIFLNNPAFDPDRYGWLEVQQPADFNGSDQVVVDLDSIPLPFGYDHIPPGTVVKFEIPGCNSCTGQVEIRRVIVQVP